MQPRPKENDNGLRLNYRKRMFLAALVLLATTLSIWGYEGVHHDAIPLPQAMITIDGKIIMVGVLGTTWKKKTINTDEAWGLLKDVEFEFLDPNEEKRRLNGRDTIIELEDGHPKELPYLYSSLRLEVPFGGTIDLRNIRLSQKGENTAGRMTWKLDANDVDSWAKRRFVHRNEVTQLIDHRFP